MKTLNSNDYVIYSRTENAMFQFSDGNQDVVIYGSYDEAILDLDKNEDEEVISCTDLPIDLQNKILNQINK
jgi:hypothetical protein